MQNMQNMQNMYERIAVRSRSRSPLLCYSCRTRDISNSVGECECSRHCDFESLCSRKCHTLVKESFKLWLFDNYGHQFQFLKNFASSRCPLYIIRNDLSYCIDVITYYIYQKYRFTIIHTNSQVENETNHVEIHNTSASTSASTITTVNEAVTDPDPDSDTDSMPSLIDDYDDLPDLIDQDPLENTINMNFHFQNFENIYKNIFPSPKIKFLERFGIVSILEELTDNKTIIQNCCICFEDKETHNFIQLGCNHEFCKDCFIKSLKSNRRNTQCCCYCRTEIKTIISRKNENHEELQNLTL
jgi:hypothetical protein